MNARVLDQTTEGATATEPSGELDNLLRARSAAPRKAGDPAAMRLGRITALRGDAADVEFPGSGGTLAARLAVAASREQLQAALQSGQPVVLVFENGDAVRPIIIGLIAAPDGAAEPAVGQTMSQAANEQQQVIEADVDGKRVRIVAQDEIVLECGGASVTLRRNGRVVIRGTYVETYSEGTNRIKGGQVRIN